MTSTTRVPTTHRYHRGACCSGRPGLSHHPRTTRKVVITGGRTREPYLVYPFPFQVPRDASCLLGGIGGGKDLERREQPSVR